MPDPTTFSDSDRRGWLEAEIVTRPATPTRAPYRAGLEWLDLEGGLAPAVFVPSTLPAGPAL
jgi:hypothetical protein